jgi:hypothetical protein
MVCDRVLKRPQCKENDQIRKVISVVGDGTASRPSEFWTSGMMPSQYPDIVSRTDLAQHLRMPTPPSPSTSPGWESAFGCAGAIGLFIVFAIIGALAHADGLINAMGAVLFFGWIGWVIFVVSRHTQERERVAKTASSWPAMQQSGMISTTVIATT